MADVEQIKQALQEELIRHGKASVEPVEAEEWLAARGLLEIHPTRAGKNVRDLLRSGQLQGSQTADRRWTIENSDLGPSHDPQYHYEVERPHAWVVRAGRGGKFADLFYSEGYIAIGHGPTPDLTGLSADGVAEAVRSAFSDEPEGRIRNHIHQLQAFAIGIQPGDLVLTPTTTHTEVMVGRVIGPYEFRDNALISEFHHYQRVSWLDTVVRSSLPAETQKSLTSSLTVYWAGAPEKLRNRFPIEEALDPLAPPKWANAWWVNQGATFKEESEGSYVWAPNSAKGGGAPKKHWRALEGMQVGDLIFSYANKAIRAVSRVTATAEVTDRPSELPLTEWEAQGWKVSARYHFLDQPISLNEIPLEWRTTEGGPFDVNGAVKQQYANHLSEHFTQLMIDRFGDRLGAITKPAGTRPAAGTTIGESMPDISTELIELIQKRKNVVLYGPPGTGKTRQAFAMAGWWEDKHGTGTVMKTTFHPSYGYEDFVQGFRPRKDDPAKFFLQPGVLLQACEAAESHDVLLIIDEINRGDVARIFGELITFIEADKRGPNHEFALAQEPGERYFIPEGLHFLGTMNTADKSVSLLDVALRRRFAFVEFGPDPNVFGSNGTLKHVEGTDLAKVLQTLNSRLLSEGIEPDRAIGHALLLISGMTSDPVQELRERMEYDIAPLVMEYSYLERDRVQRVLGTLVDAQGHFRPDLSRQEFLSLMKALGSGAPQPATETTESDTAALMEAEAFAAEQEEEQEEA